MGIDRPPLLVALMLMRGVAIIVAAFAAFGVFAALGTPDAWSWSLLSTNVSIVAIDVLTLVILGRLQRRQGKRLRDLFLPTAGARDLGWSLLVFVILLVSFVVTTFVANLVVYQGPPPGSGVHLVPPLWLGIWGVTIMPVTIALAEEGLYRGYLRTQVGAWLGRIPALFVVSFAFGLQHAGFSMTSLSAVAARVFSLFLIGLVFAGLMAWFKRLAPLVVAHWLMDVLGLGLPMLLAALAG